MIITDKIVRILGLTHGEDALPPGSPAARDWYFPFKIYDEDYEEVLGTDYVNVTEEVDNLHNLAVSYAIEELEYIWQKLKDQENRMLKAAGVEKSPKGFYTFDTAFKNEIANLKKSLNHEYHQ